MFSSRNGQATPGLKNFGMQAPSKGLPGVRVFKGPTLSTFNLNPFSAASANFDSFDVGYRPGQSEFPTQGRCAPGPIRSQQPPSRTWQTPSNIYVPSNPPPSASSQSYQQNPIGAFGLRTASQSSASRSQEPPRHRDPQQQQQQPAFHDHNYYIHPGISTDMYIYEASDALSEYSPSPSPSPFSPALSTDSTLTLQSPSPLPVGQSELLRDQGRNATPFLRTTTPVPPSRVAQSRAQSQSYPTSSYSSHSSNSGTSFPSGLPGLRQAQNALRGLFGSNGQPSEPMQTQSMGNGLPRIRTPSESSSIPNALPNSETEFDDLARMNTALNAGYSYYFPESKPQIRPRLPSTAGVNASSHRSPRDSLMFYDGIQRTDDELMPPYSQSAPLNVPTPMSDQPPSSILEASGVAASSNLVPALERSISSSSQSSELSILRTPSPTFHAPQRPPSRLQSQSQPYSGSSVQLPASSSTSAAFATVLSASPEPQISSAPVPTPPTSSQPQSRTSSTSSSSSNPNDTSFTPSTIRGRVPAISIEGQAGAAERSNTTVMFTDISTNQAYPMPRVAPTESRSFNSTAAAAPPTNSQNISQSGSRNTPRTSNVDSRSGSGVPLTTGNSETRHGVVSESSNSPTRTRKLSSSENSPPRILSQCTPDPQRVDPPARSSLPTTTLAPPQQVLTRVRKDSMSLGMKSSSSSRPTNRSNQPPAPFSNIGVNGESNGETLAASSKSSTIPPNPLSAVSAVSTPIPSSFPEPRRRHSDSDNPALTDATRRSAVPFKTEFVPVVSSSGSHVSREGPSRDTSTWPTYTDNRRPEPTRSRSADAPLLTRQESVNPRPAVETLRSRCVRWNEELICPSPIWPSQRRKGWFNRRGDQLWTNGGAFRSPPPGGEYPPDLDGYPNYGEGWMNEEGIRIDMVHRLIPKAPLRSALKTKK